MLLFLFYSGMVYDFDIMLQRRKEINSRRRRRKNVDIINDSDDIIAELIQEMKQAADVCSLISFIYLHYLIYTFKRMIVS